MLDVTHELVEGNYTAGAPIVLQVTLSWDADEEDEENDQLLIALFYLAKKIPNWWLVVGKPASKQLLVIERVTINKSLDVKLIAEGDAQTEALCYLRLVCRR